MNETDSTLLYVLDMCRILTMRYQKDIDWSQVRLRRFNLTIDNFQSSEEDPANDCYDSIFKLPSGESTETGYKSPETSSAQVPQMIDLWINTTKGLAEQRTNG